jgi:Tfp pilus assembly protein PilO
VSRAPKSARLTPRAQLGLVIAGLLLLAAGGYMVLVKPKRSEAARVETQVVAVQKQIADRRSASAVRQVKAAVRTADLFRLAKAIPQDENMASILLELSHLASDAGISFQSITPEAAVEGTGYHALPIKVTFSGNFFTLTDFLYRLRQLVQVHDGQLDVTGRFFAVDSVSFTEDSERKFPFVDAELHLNAFAFGDLPGTVGAVTSGSESTSTDTSTTQTTTTETTPQQTSTTGADAAPANPSS